MSKPNYRIRRARVSRPLLVQVAPSVAADH